MPNEIELKLRIAKNDVARLRRHPVLRRHATGKAGTRRLVSIYYDTPDLKLLDAAISLRVRRMYGGWFQAVKGAGHSLAGLHQRMEWEDLLTRGEPDFSKITEPSLAALFADQDLRNALSPIFITDVRRTEWQLEYAGSTIEAALDLGELKPGNGDGTEPAEDIHELELELKQGQAAHVFELALALQTDIPLHIENISKAQRGYAYYRPAPPVLMPTKPTVALPAAITEAQAYRQMVGDNLQQLQNGQEVFALTASPESVVSMRSALRQLDFSSQIFAPQRSDLHRDLSWISAALNTVHEWQIFVHQVLPMLQGNILPPEMLDRLQQQAAILQDSACMKLRKRVDSQRYQRMLLNLGVTLVDETDTSGGALLRLRHSMHLQQGKLTKHYTLLQEPSCKKLRKLQEMVDHLRYGTALMAVENSDHQPNLYVALLADLQEALTALQAIVLGAEYTALVLRHAGYAADQAHEKVRQQMLQHLPSASSKLDSAWHAVFEA